MVVTGKKKLTWEVKSIPHSFQTDDSSCGVYVMKVHF